MPESVKHFGSKLWLHVLYYLYALAASSWNAGIAGAVASLGVAAGAAISPDTVHALDLHQLTAAFVYGAVINALFRLRSNPVPEKLRL